MVGDQALAVRRRHRLVGRNTGLPLVLDGAMPSRLRLLLAVLAAALLPASTAVAAIIEVGDLPTKNAPSCPASPCQAISRTTGFQAKVGEVKAPFVMPTDGKIVAWSITLAAPTAEQVAFFDKNLGGPAAAGISVIKPGGRLFYRVTGKSTIQPLTPYFGQTVQFAMGRSLNVRKGYIVALTVPTWAPALALGLGNDSSWRASRNEEQCDQTQDQSAQTQLKSLARYRCLYRTARLTYTVTLVTRPKPTAENAPV
jgi:hypothetical protein